jgi:hypothetical protein
MKVSFYKGATPNVVSVTQNLDCIGINIASRVIAAQVLFIGKSNADLSSCNYGVDGLLDMYHLPMSV